MIKKSLYFLFLCLIFSSFTNAKSTNKIAIVNTSNIFQQSKKYSEMIKQLEKEFINRANELQFMENEIRKKIQYLHRNELYMSINERDKLEKLLEEQKEKFSNKAQIFEEDNQRRHIEERDKILESINNILKKIVDKEGYDIVIDSSAIAYNNKIKDITDEVLSIIK